MSTHTDLIKRLRVIANAIADGNYSELTMRIPAEPDRDADIVVMRSALALEALEQQVAALRVDAERYRWLRERHWVEGETRFRLNLMQATSDHEADMLELDSSIDAAMGEK